MPIKESTNHDDEYALRPSLSILPSLERFEVVITDHQRRYYAGPAMKVVSTFSNGSAATAATTRSSGSFGDGSRGNGSSSSSSSSPSTPQRSVTFRDRRRVPRSVNAGSISRCCSNLSREEEGDGSFGVGVAARADNPSRDGATPSSSPASSSPPSPARRGSNRSSTARRDLAPDAASSSPTARRDLAPDPDPVKFAFCHSARETRAERRGETGFGNDLATYDMFTREDVEAITPLQISAYLTVKERESVGTKVLCSKLKKGYALIDGGKTACETCSMPMLSKSGKINETCLVCPALKRRVLMKILEGCSGNF